MYLRPEARITQKITGRSHWSVARDESIDPIRTAGTLPTMMAAVRENWTLPNVRAPRAAAAVRGMAWAGSVPTRLRAGGEGDTNVSIAITSEPDPSDVSPTAGPPPAPVMPTSSPTIALPITTCPFIGHTPPSAKLAVSPTISSDPIDTRAEVQ